MTIQQPSDLPPVPSNGAALPVDAAGNLNPPVPALLANPAEPPPASRWLIFVYFLTMFAGSFAILAPTLFAVAYKVQLIDPKGKATSLGIIMGIAAVVNLIAGPLFGVLSDRTRLRWGRRRPWILFGILVCAVSGILMALAPNTVIVGVGWSLYTIGLAAALDAMNPVLVETIPTSQRGKVGALVGVGGQVAGVLGVVIGSVILGNLLLLFLVPVAAFALTFVLYVLTLPDAPAERTATQESPWLVFRQLVFNPLKHRDFSLVWIGKFTMSVGVTFLSTYQLYFLLDRLGLLPQDAGQKLALVGGLGVLVTTLFAMVGGILSDRLKRRKLFIYLATAFSVVGLVLLAFTQNIPLFTVAVLFVLAAAGLFGSVDLALVSDVIPDSSQAGRWMGIYYVSTTVSTAIAPIFAPFILLIGGGGNYTALFLTGAVIALITAIAASRIRAVR